MAEHPNAIPVKCSMLFWPASEASETRTAYGYMAR